MVTKALMGAAIGLTFLSLAFMAPNGWGMTSSASPEPVKKEGAAGPSSTHRRTRGPRYVFVGFYGGK